MREHLLHNLIRLLPGFLGKFYLFPFLCYLLHLYGTVNKKKRDTVLCADLSQQKADPQILSASRIQPF